MCYRGNVIKTRWVIGNGFTQFICWYKIPAISYQLFKILVSSNGLLKLSGPQFHICSTMMVLIMSIFMAPSRFSFPLFSKVLCMRPIIISTNIHEDNSIIPNLCEKKWLFSKKIYFYIVLFSIYKLFKTTKCSLQNFLGINVCRPSDGVLVGEVENFIVLLANLQRWEKHLCEKVVCRSYFYYYCYSLKKRNHFFMKHIKGRKITNSQIQLFL